jgi:hypothetical protein
LISLTEKASKLWNSPVYAFYGEVFIEHVNGRISHSFLCAKPGCKVAIRRYQDKGDAKSTSNLWNHIRSCWGQLALDAAQKMANRADCHKNVVKNLLKNWSITAAFESKGKGKVTYSNIAHTKAETRWVSQTPIIMIPDINTERRLSDGCLRASDHSRSYLTQVLGLQGPLVILLML